MKPFIIVLLFLPGVENYAYSQSFCKEVCAYAFQRFELPGMIADVENTAIQSAIDTSYFIYLEQPSGIHLSADEIWIKGHGFVVAKMELEQTPVVINYSLTGSTIRSDTLIRKKETTVYRLYKGKKIGQPAPTRFRTIVHSNDVVIFYKVKSTYYFTSLKKLTTIESIAFK